MPKYRLHPVHLRGHWHSLGVSMRAESGRILPRIRHVLHKSWRVAVVVDQPTEHSWRKKIMPYHLLFRYWQRFSVNTLRYSSVKKFLNIFCNKVKFNRASARALSIDSDLIRIATKIRYVPLDPSQGFNLIQKTSIEITNGCVSECRRCKEPERWQTVVYWDNNNILALMNPMIKGPVGRIAKKIAL